MFQNIMFRTRVGRQHRDEEIEKCKKDIDGSMFNGEPVKNDVGMYNRSSCCKDSLFIASMGLNMKDYFMSCKKNEPKVPFNRTNCH